VPRSATKTEAKADKAAAQLSDKKLDDVAEHDFKLFQTLKAHKAQLEAAKEKARMQRLEGSPPHVEPSLRAAKKPADPLVTEAAMESKAQLLYKQFEAKQAQAKLQAKAPPQRVSDEEQLEKTMFEKAPVLKQLKPLEPSELHALEVKRKDFEEKVTHASPRAPADEAVRAPPAKSPVELAEEKMRGPPAKPLSTVRSSAQRPRALWRAPVRYAWGRRRRSSRTSCTSSTPTRRRSARCTRPSSPPSRRRRGRPRAAQCCAPSAERRATACAGVGVARESGAGCCADAAALAGAARQAREARAAGGEAQAAAQRSAAAQHILHRCAAAFASAPRCTWRRRRRPRRTRR
jgi:hypothetical protein